jgi:phosphoribosylformimino-5-aminoimidazole carboxamide ribotide isomerase
MISIRELRSQPGELNFKRVGLFGEIPDSNFSRVIRGMQIFPVLDLMKGNVVRGVAGRRESYRPVESVLTSHSDPFSVAEAFHTQLGLSQFYVADLDGIQFARPQLALIEQLVEAFPGLWLDCGIRLASDIPSGLVSREVRFVVGLETVAGPKVLEQLCRQLGSERMVFSLDLKAGLPMGHLENWCSPSPGDIAREAIEAGVRKLIVLDLSAVGRGAGVSTLPLCREIKRDFPEVQVITGGGIRNIEDLISLNDSQIDGVLLASAFHNGSIGRGDLQRFASSDNR